MGYRFLHAVVSADSGVRRWIRNGACCAVALLLMPACRGGHQDAVEALTGHHTRVTWVQDHSGSRDVFATGRQLLLMGYDSRDGRGERPLLPEPRACKRPIFTPDGTRVLFSDIHSGDIHVLDWDGRRPAQRVAGGFAVDAWRDSDTGETWLYALDDPQDKGRTRYARLVRFPLERPDQRDTVWDQTPLSPDNIQISADGRFTAGLLPWPDAYAMSLPDRQRHRIGRGCWVSLAPDNSYLAWVFDGAHRNVTLSLGTGGETYQVRINTAPEMKGYEVYHPRWSNHVRFMTVTGPYLKGGGDNRIRGGGEDVEIYIGRFDPAWRTIEDWVRVTHNERGDFYPDVWIAGAHTNSVHAVIGASPEQPLVLENGVRVATAPPRIELTEAWPPTHAQLQFLWRNNNTQNDIRVDPDSPPLACSVTARDRAYFHHHHDMHLAGGAFLADNVNQRLLDACRASGELTIQCVLTSASLEQEGPARIISFSSDIARRNFTLGQQNGDLVLRLRTPRTGLNGLHPQVTLFPIEVGRPTHLIVTYQPGRLVVYRDGEEIRRSVDVQGDFSNWTEQQLVFGAEADGGRDWDGRLEFVALYSRAMAPEEVSANHAQVARVLAGRQPVERHRLEGRLLTTLNPPDREVMGTYTRALVMGVYAVDRVPGGDQPGDIVVAQWAIIDNRPVRLPQPGDRQPLLLECWDDHPQLGSELRIETDRLDLPVFMEVGPVER